MGHIACRIIQGLLFVAILASTARAAVLESKGDFVLWQLPSQINSHMNSYVFQLGNGKVVVMDGGSKGEAAYLRGFLAALGNEVEAWFITHPHFDHIEALNEILKAPQGLKINTIYHSRMSAAYLNVHELQYRDLTVEFYERLDQFEGTVVDLTKPGLELVLSHTHFKVLGVKNEEITNNPYNNQSIVIKVWDDSKSVLFLADLGLEGGDKLLSSPYRPELDCDYLQVSHHGQAGVSKDFYRTIRFRACLWPTPEWLYNNDAGNGYNTHTWETVEIRELMDALGINEHHLSFQGLARIE